MGYGFYDLIMNIPGASKLYIYLRRAIFRKSPPVEFEKVDLSHYEKSNLIKTVEDKHGIRIQFGKPPIQVLQERSKIVGPSVNFSIEKSQETIGLISEEMKIKFEVSTSETGWIKLDLHHQFKQIFGLSEKHGSLNRQGQSYEFWNVDAASMEPKDDPLYKNYPLAIANYNGKWVALVVDFPGFQKWELFENNHTIIYLKGQNFVFDLVVATSIKELMTKIANLTGNMELPPRWSLGFHQSRWSYHPASRVKEIANTFRDKDIPIDTIYLDIDYLDGFRCFTYDSENFGDLPNLVEKLHDLGLKVVCMIDPGIKREKGYHVYDQGIEHDYFVKKPKKGKVYVAPVWPGKSVFPDFFNEEVRKWWGQLYEPFTSDIGIDGWWNDMNEPSIFTLRGTMPDNLIHTLDDGTKVTHGEVHNLFGQMMVKASYEGLKKLQKGKRVFLLSRAGYLGSQKFGWIWSGDNKSAWDHLQQSLPKIMGTGLTGHFANGPDIGGFRDEASPELFARWIQLGIFYPFMRNHYIKFTEEQEPWSFGEEVEEISREMIKLRYRLMPYIYTQFRQSCVTGVPLMRPMFFEFPNDQNCYKESIINNQFMFGTDMLIAPVLKEGDIAKDVYLPKGNWHLLDSKKKYQGGKTVVVSAPLDTINIFVRDNTIIPVYQEVGKNMEETVASGIEYVTYGDHPVGLLYLDDGETYEFQNGKFGLYKIKSDLSLELIEGEGYED